MGLTYQDVGMVNQGLDRLGDTLLRNRILEQQKQERGEALGERRREFNVTAGQADRRTAVDEKNADTMAKYREQVLKDANVQKGIANIRAQVDQITRLHSAGQINTAEANRKIKLLQDQLRRSPELLIEESGLADVNFQDIPADQADASDVEKDRTAAELERQAAAEADPAAKQILLARAKQLRSGIGRQDPAQYIEETLVLERDEDSGQPRRTQRRRIPAGQVDHAAAPKGKPLTLEQAQEFLKQAGGDKGKARELARQAGYTF